VLGEVTGRSLVSLVAKSGVCGLGLAWRSWSGVRGGIPRLVVEGSVMFVDSGVSGTRSCGDGKTCGRVLGLRLMATEIWRRDESLADGYRRLAAMLSDVLAEQRVDAVLWRVAGTLRELIRCEDVVIWELVAPDALIVALVDGEDEQEMRSLRIRLGEGLTGAAALERAAVVSNDAHEDPRAGLVPGTEPTPEAVVCMPLVGRGELLGVLSLYRRGDRRAFREEEVELVTHFADVAALALDNAKIRAELERLAATDDLTGLPNRRRFHEELAPALAAARRYGSPLSLLLLDLDDLKQINDSHGHEAGDEMLRTVADAIRMQLRESDLAARIGGDEFALLLPHTGRVAAGTLARRIQEALAALPTAPLTISASVGTATLTQRTGNLFAEADQRLYEAKRQASRQHTVRGGGAD
jgi:diguanylate cyclase (GGDEF)-like protein